MDVRDDVEFGGVWAGLSTILVAVLAAGVFVFTSDPINTGGVVASVALGVVGLAELLAPRVGPWFHRLPARWTGLCWMLVGLGLAVLGVVSSTTVGKFGGGLIVGMLFVVYGCHTAFER